MRRALLALIVLVPALVHAQPAEPPVPRGDLELTMGAGLLRAQPSSESRGETAAFIDVGFGGSYVASRHLAFLVEAHGLASLYNCQQDGSCWDVAYRRVAMFGGGVRWLRTSSSYLQATAITGWTASRGTFHRATGVTLALGWDRHGFPNYRALELRASGWTETYPGGGTRVTVIAVGLGVTLGHSSQ